MCSEQFQSEILKVIENFTLEDLEASETKQCLTKTEIVDNLLDILKNYFGVEVNTKIIQNKTVLLESKCPEKLKDLNQTSILEERNEFLNQTSLLMDVSEEVCRSEENGSKTISIEGALGIEEKLNTTEIKTASSPVIFINDVGRSDTFEIENSKVLEINVISPSDTTKNIDSGSWFNSKRLKELTTKLEKAQSDISTIVRSATTIHTEIIGIKMEFQKETNKISLPKQRISKSPSISATPTKLNSTLTKTTRMSVSTKRRSASFSTIKDGLQLKSYSPNLFSTSPSLGPRQKSVTVFQDQKNINTVPKNPKYAHVQSTIPKSLPIQKRNAKQ